MTPASQAGTSDAVRIEQLPLNQIQTRDQVRKYFDPDALKQLAESIKIKGVISPIIVRNSRTAGDGTAAITPYEIVAGERRWRAATMASLEVIPSIIRNDLSDDDAEVLQLIENLQREGLTLWDESVGVAKLVAKIGFERTVKETGMSEAWVSKRKNLVNLPEEVLELVKTGKVTSSEIALNLGALKEFKSRDYQRTMDAFRGGSHSYDRPPTREQLRERVEDAKAKFKIKQAEIAEQKKQAEKVASNPKLAAKAEAEKKAAKDAGGARKLREQQCQSLKLDVERTQAELLKAMLDFIPGDGRAKGSTKSPIKIWNRTHFSEYGSDPIPAAADLLKFDVDFEGPLALIKQAVNVLAPGAMMRTTRLQVTQEQAAQIEKIVGAPIIWETEACNLRPPAIRKKIEAAQASTAKPKAPEIEGEGASVEVFLMLKTRRNPSARIKSEELYEAYAAWCKADKRKPIALRSNAWGATIENAGFKKIRSNGYRYVGLELVP